MTVPTIPSPNHAKAIEVVDMLGGESYMMPITIGVDNAIVVPTLSAGTITQSAGQAITPVADLSSAYNYGFSISGASLFVSTGAAKKCYLLSITGDRIAGKAVTGDSNDALVKVSGNNYAANDANFILRAGNFAINNRSGGVLGTLESGFGAQNKSGGTVTNIHAVNATGENYGSATVIGAGQFLVKNEGTDVTDEHVLFLDNENAGSGSSRACGTAIKIKSGGAKSTGYNTLIDATAATLLPAGNVVTLFTFKDSGGVTKIVTFTAGATALVVG